jgi:hypothetical protein
VISTGGKIQIKHGGKLIRGNDTQFADLAAIFIRENICVYGKMYNLPPLIPKYRQGLPTNGNSLFGCQA